MGFKRVKWENSELSRFKNYIQSSLFILSSASVVVNNIHSSAINQLYKDPTCDAMVLGKLPVPGRPTILITVGQGPIALAVGAGGGGLDIFTLIYPFPSFSLSLGDGLI